MLRLLPRLGLPMLLMLWGVIRLSNSMSFGIALLFWASAIFFWIEAYQRGIHYGVWFGGIGGSLNAVASLSNGGRMPVLDYTINAGPFWQPMPAHVHFYYLCDIWHWMSVGDFFILAALLVGSMEFLSSRKAVTA